MKLEGKKFVILATDGFEQSELEQPLAALRDEGGQVEVVSLEAGEIRGWSNGEWGDSITVDRTVDEVSADDYDGLVLPGGVINPDRLRADEKVQKFVKGFFTEGRQKPVAAICHGPWTLINAEVVRGREMTSYRSLAVDLKNAGANWVDKEVVVDNGLVTSRSPGDLKAFCKKMIEEFHEGTHRKKAAS